MRSLTLEQLDAEVLRRVSHMSRAVPSAMRIRERRLAEQERVARRFPSQAEIDAAVESFLEQTEVKPKEPTLADVIEKAKAPTYTEIYAIFRNRDPDQLDDDRLLDCLMTAPSLEEAMGKLITIAGYDETEAKALELDQFGVGDVCGLCDRLKALTGDTYEVSPYEQPIEP
ncbi:hypothetical protein FV222_00205 [Methylobacterium sp. WL103]|uniref:hypothetical protein n=1 Tax=Methylobacterium sp. WL103 TaxID=2603891 RepID=UPI0011C84674|nr:hypothetical protein [Methylobacterium sp. WL103]TXN08928.1 hypothetical protein FV222_00205 [Methylobacterium sp. WL103]